MGNRSPKSDPRKIAAVNHWGREGPIVRCMNEVLPGFSQTETPARICRDCRRAIQHLPLPGEKRRHNPLTDPQGKLFT